MLTNYHFHSCCSFDGEHPLWEMCAAAEAGGVRNLCLTDHCDLLDGKGQPDDSFSWEAVDGQLADTRARLGLEVRRGIELGEAILRPEAAEKILARAGIDFVLGSMHTDRQGIDYYYMHHEDPALCRKQLEEYLLCLLELAKTDFFDSLAHLNYPIRYMRYRDGVEVTLAPLEELVYEILKTLVYRGKALEVNTSGYLTCGGEPMPPERILRMYRELGGELVTVGSDAHVPENMTLGLERGMELLRQCGFRYLTLYKERKPQQIML